MGLPCRRHGGAGSGSGPRRSSAMLTFQIRHNQPGTGDREVPFNGGEFRFVRVVRGWFPGDCHVLREGEDVSTPNGLLAFIKELGLAEDLRKEVLATLKKDGRV